MEPKESCIFCQIVHRKKPASILWEDEKHLAFLDIRPTTKGHTLVIPKAHYRTFLDIPMDAMNDYMVFMQKTAYYLKRTLNFAGFNLFQNNESVAGQIVFHIHFHIVPRYTAEDIQYSRPLVTYEPGEEQRLLEQFNNEIHTSFNDSHSIT